MRYYIILQPTLRSMGGEEMYTRNKVIEAKSKGYEPLVLHSDIWGEKMFIDDLRQFEKYGFPEFKFTPSIVSSNRRNHVIRRIREIIDVPDSDSILESHEIIVALWGELIAHELGICHLAYMLLEHQPIERELFDFFMFKYKRHELVGIAKKTLPDMFAPFDCHVEGFCLPAFCHNVIENTACPESFKLKDADYTIGTIGRTNKQYVLPMTYAIAHFLQLHPQKRFNILYVGGSMDKKSEEQVIKVLSSQPNAHLTFTGMIYPLSIEMIQQMDVCIASAGSCSAGYDCGVPTISVDGNDSMAIGIFRETTRNSLFRNKDEQPIPIEDLLETILIEKKYKKKEAIPLAELDFSSHWSFLTQMVPEKDYFDVETISMSYIKKIKSWILGFSYGLPHDSLIRRMITKSIDVLLKLK